MTKKEAFDRVFVPQSVAIVGGTPREPGQLVLESFLASGFRGEIYPVDSRVEEVAGHKAYGSVADVPSMFAYGARSYSLIKALVTYEGFADLSVLHIGFGQASWVPSAMLEGDIDFFNDAVIKLKRDTNRPLALVMQYLVTGWDWQKGVEDLQQGCAAAGVPVYHSMASAARAVDQVLQCDERRRKTASQESSALNELT